MEEASKEVKKMTAFIMQEASEKAHEIRLKADEEYAVEKARLLKAEADALTQLQERRWRDGQVKLRVVQSREEGRVRVRVLNAKEELLEQVFEQVRLAELKKIVEDEQEYARMMQALLQEGLKMLGSVQEVQCRPGDTCLVQSLVKASCNVSGVLHDCQGGVVLLGGKGGKVKCDNTVDKRLQLAVEDLLPLLREQIFGICSSRKFFD